METDIQSFMDNKVDIITSEKGYHFEVITKRTLYQAHYLALQIERFDEALLLTRVDRTKTVVLLFKDMTYSICVHGRR